MEKQYLQFKVAEATKEKMTIVASDETLDRYGEVVPLDAWDFKNYKKNPVLLVDHDYKISKIVMEKYCIIDSENNSTYVDTLDDLPDNCRVFELDEKTGNYIEIEQ